ncbi:MAG: Tn7-like element transposition protein TnsE [Desulfuromonas sp.]|nr:Tn7-like element transposition protein TnsE [Desulfuromonas sp.]
MQNNRFADLEDDVKIKSLGSLFRKENGTNWAINIGFFPHQQKKAMSISNAPVLVRNRILNPTTIDPSTGYSRSFTIENTCHWDTVKIGDCPIFAKTKLSKYEANQFCFLFHINNGIAMYLPQFEFARALFLHDGYLSRSALEPECLKAEFDVTINSDMAIARVNVMEISGYPLKSLDDDGARNILSWILLDPEARRSFESIGYSQKGNGKQIGGYRHWDFQFKPPSLPGARLSVRGRFDDASNSLFVYEISEISNIVADMPEVIEFFHPKVVENIRGDASLRTSGPADPPSQYNVHDVDEANSHNHHLLLRAPAVKFGFAKAFKSIMVFDKQRSGSTGRKDDDATSSEIKDVSTEEPMATGSFPCADWDILSDITDDAHLYANKFDCFHQMLELLENEHQCTILSKVLHRLPKILRGKKHLLANDGTPRFIAVVEISTGGQCFHLIEVDTSDAINSLSTQLLSVKSQQSWSVMLEILEHDLVKNSLRWPKNILRQICGPDGYKGIPHPSSDSAHKGMLDPDSVSNWAKRVYRWMEQLK